MQPAFSLMQSINKTVSSEKYTNVFKIHPLLKTNPKCVSDTPICAHSLEVFPMGKNSLFNFVIIMTMPQNDPWISVKM